MRKRAKKNPSLDVNPVTNGVNWILDSIVHTPVLTSIEQHTSEDFNQITTSVFSIIG
jgi:hypothetical protein